MVIKLPPEYKGDENTPQRGSYLRIWYNQQQFQDQLLQRLINLGTETWLLLIPSTFVAKMGHR